MQKQFFLEQTAKDYDMDIYDVELIHRIYPDTFYEELEIFIKDRAKRSAGESFKN